MNSLVTAFTISAISKSFLIKSGLFRFTSLVLLYRKKFLDDFIFGYLLSEIKIAQNLLQIMYSFLFLDNPSKGEKLQ